LDGRGVVFLAFYVGANFDESYDERYRGAYYRKLKKEKFIKSKKE
jgi:hypothetical protein